MPAPLGLECLHPHCTRVHNKRIQMPTSSFAKAQLKIHASKKMPASTTSGARPRRCPRSHLIHVWKDTRVHPLGVHTEMHAPRHTRVQEDTRVGLLLRAPKMAAPTWTRAKMHASPLLPAPRRCTRLGGYGASTESSLPPIFRPRSPHDQEQREEEVWL